MLTRQPEPNLKRIASDVVQIHEELQDYDELIAKFQEAPVPDWESIVSARRADMSTEFFSHVNCRVQALHVRFHSILCHHILGQLQLHKCCCVLS